MKVLLLDDFLNIVEVMKRSEVSGKSTTGQKRNKCDNEKSNKETWTKVKNDHWNLLFNNWTKTPNPKHEMDYKKPKAIQPIILGPGGEIIKPQYDAFEELKETFRLINPRPEHVYKKQAYSSDATNDNSFSSLKSLRSFLLSFFKGDKINVARNFNKMEVMIFNAIFRQKFGKVFSGKFSN